jgi:hypothetical protein
LRVPGLVFIDLFPADIQQKAGAHRITFSDVKQFPIIRQEILTPVVNGKSAKNSRRAQAGRWLVSIRMLVKIKHFGELTYTL